MKNIIVELYKLDQNETREYIKKVLKEKNIDYKEVAGNLYSLRFKGKPVFVSHMDTVEDLDMKKDLIYDKNLKMLSRKNGILGSDDKAGINLILNHIEDINFLFTVDEEIGCLGIQDLVSLNFIQELKDNNICCAIELDRKGNSDILGADHGYCDFDLQEELEKALPDYKSEIGVCTDIDYICESVPSCNLSVGYYLQHTNEEYLMINEFDYINSRIPFLDKIRGDFKSGEKYYYEEVCGICGNTESEMEYVDILDMHICSSCRRELLEKLFYLEY